VESCGSWMPWSKAMRQLARIADRHYLSSPRVDWWPAASGNDKETAPATAAAGRIIPRPSLSYSHRLAARCVTFSELITSASEVLRLSVAFVCLSRCLFPPCRSQFKSNLGRTELYTQVSTVPKRNCLVFGQQSIPKLNQDVGRS